MQEKKNNKIKNNEGEEELPGAEESVPCWSDCFAGGVAIEAGGSVVAHGRWLQAVVLLFQAAGRAVTALPFSSVSFPLLSISLSLSSVRSLSLSLSLWLVLSILVPFLFVFFLLRFVLFSFCPLPVLALGAIYRAKGAGLFIIAHREQGSAGWLASRRGWQGAAPLVSHHQRAWGFGSWQSTWEERGNIIKEEKTKKILSSPTTRPGEEERGILSFKTTPFCSFFFFFKMKQRRFEQNAPFHLNKKKVPKRVNFQINPQSILCSIKYSNVILILKINSNASLPTSIAALIVGHLFHFGSWFLIYAI